MLAPQVADWAEKRGQSASRYLMPFSFATILGGTITLIGTSTNLVVSGLMQEAGLAPHRDVRAGPHRPAGRARGDRC